jgi:hypothetical protein
MRIPDLFKDLAYVGKAEGDKKLYYVFENPKGFLVVAGNAANAYNVNWVDRKAVDLVHSRFKGRKITTVQIRKKAGRRKLFTGGFAALNTLYAMVATGRARKLRERQGRAMVFKVSSTRR